MMEQRTDKSPIDLMADLLAVMATRAIEVERKAESHKSDSDNWYKFCKLKDVELNEAEAKLAAEIEEHQRTRQALHEALADTEKGAQQNG